MKEITYLKLRKKDDEFCDVAGCRTRAFIVKRTADDNSSSYEYYCTNHHIEQLNNQIEKDETRNARLSAERFALAIYKDSIENIAAIYNAEQKAKEKQGV